MCFTTFAILQIERSNLLYDIMTQNIEYTNHHNPNPKNMVTSPVFKFKTLRGKHDLFSFGNFKGHANKDTN
jgi:hypothetical protein